MLSMNRYEDCVRITGEDDEMLVKEQLLMLSDMDDSEMGLRVMIEPVMKEKEEKVEECKNNVPFRTCQIGRDLVGKSVKIRDSNTELTKTIILTEEETFTYEEVFLPLIQ